MKIVTFSKTTHADRDQRSETQAIPDREIKLDRFERQMLAPQISIDLSLRGIEFSAPGIRGSVGPNTTVIDTGLSEPFKC